MAPSGYRSPASARSSDESRTSRSVRLAGSCTASDSMSSANPSNRSPRGVVYASTSRTRARSSTRSVRCGRYQATTRIPSSCAASRKAAVASGNTNADERAALDDCRYSVRTPRADMSAAAAAGSAHAGSS